MNEVSSTPAYKELVYKILNWREEGRRRELSAIRKGAISQTEFYAYPYIIPCFVLQPLLLNSQTCHRLKPSYGNIRSGSGHARLQWPGQIFAVVTRLSRIGLHTSTPNHLSRLF